MYLSIFVFFVVVFGSIAVDSRAGDLATSQWLSPVTDLSKAESLPDTGQRLTRRAEELIGIPYKWGGMTEENGFDCSGLLVYLFRSEAGVELPRTTRAMIREGFPRVHREELQPGDAVFFSRSIRGQVNHVGLYIGNNRFIHAPRTGRTIRIDSLDNQYWSDRYSSARRFETESDS